ncbi:glycerophosphodiester phosphodiesterase [Meiothermus granaticius]|uniref:Glycerophosphodiester phosphodiesterase, cytoplasmic n=1 Tax=Meiothermus granaticius NBRC 107808 TaxID=1227551 RepID=A0A399F7P2_9DEIN|nr:glycerophosphodiester phosphodiesterase [Meiothermus granaticius]RIH90912.1 Glycerophosphodiester phosphodiesterase, cytoplasmic [Meiothermus granaticius NBRC 107808]GEM87383.1 glycerophosphoryl diester phosphodiesterase [Meiothermus granaticius NBRC 107808]
MQMPHPLLLGHRGAPRQAPENTLESYRLALQAGLDGLEFDVQRTRDGVLAIHHDFDLEGQPIAELSWAELRASAPEIPRLEEVLALTQEFPGIWLNLELKSQPPDSDGREAALAELLQAQPNLERLWISSFDPLALIRLKHLGVTVPLALLAYQQEMLELLPCLPVQGVHPHHSLLNEANVSEFKAKGWFVGTWTINDPALAQTLLRWGVDVLIGDFPERLLQTRS